MPKGPKGSTRGYSSFSHANVMEEQMRSARHWCKIDSRSNLTYMKNIGINVLIMGVQKPSVPLARLRQLQPMSAVSFSSAPVLLRLDCELSGI